MQFDYVSTEFTTYSECKAEEKKLTDAILNHFGLKRDEFRLNRGTVTLQGFYNGTWQNLANYKIDFKEKIESPLWIKYRLKSNLEQK